MKECCKAVTREVRWELRVEEEGGGRKKGKRDC